MKKALWMSLAALLAGCGGTAAPASAPAASVAPAGGQPASTAAKPAASGGASAAAKPGSGPVIKIAYSSLSAMGLPFEAAADTGIFSRLGITGEPIYTAGSPNSI